MNRATDFLTNSNMKKWTAEKRKKVRGGRLFYPKPLHKWMGIPREGDIRQWWRAPPCPSAFSTSWSTQKPKAAMFSATLNSASFSLSLFYLSVCACVWFLLVVSWEWRQYVSVTHHYTLPTQSPSLHVLSPPLFVFGTFKRTNSLSFFFFAPTTELPRFSSSIPHLLYFLCLFFFVWKQYRIIIYFKRLNLSACSFFIRIIYEQPTRCTRPESTAGSPVVVHEVVVPGKEPCFSIQPTQWWRIGFDRARRSTRMAFVLTSQYRRYDKRKSWPSFGRKKSHHLLKRLRLMSAWPVTIAIQSPKLERLQALAFYITRVW